MATNPTSELATLTQLLNTPELTSLFVKVVIQGEIQLEVYGPLPMDRIVILLEPYVVTDIYLLVTEKGGHPSWLRECIDLFGAVQKGWLDVQSGAAPAVPQAIIPAQPNYIPTPPNPQIGDALVFNGTSWQALPVGPNGYVLTSNGAGFLPNYQPAPGGGGGGGNPQISGQNTTLVTKGDVCYLSGPNTWRKASAESGVVVATSGGIFGGTPGVLDLSGAVVTEVKCTTSGGQPMNGARLFLASSSDDGGTGAGKVTAIPPTPPPGGTVNLQIVGICVDNSNYAAFKVVKAIFQPSYPTILVG